MIKPFVKSVATLVLLALAPAAFSQSATLDRIRDRGVLTCGVTTNLSGFAERSGDDYSGFEVDYCKAIAVAILNDESFIDYVPLRAGEATDALRRARVDVLMRATSRSFSADTFDHVNFAPVVLFDTQRILVRPSLGVSTLEDLIGKRVCVEGGSTSEASFNDFLTRSKLDIEPVSMGTAADSIVGISSGQCEGIAAPLSKLNAMMTLTQDGNFGKLLPEKLDDYQISFSTREGDDEWSDIVSWVVNATILAEEVGLTQADLVDGFRFTPDAHKNTLALMGLNFSIGTPLRLDDSWAFRVLATVGNYGEIYERNLGAGSDNRTIRGLNRLWNQGGMIWAPPLR